MNVSFPLACSSIKIGEHALGRMFNRGIEVADIRAVIQNGEIIANYPVDKPYPSCLILGFISGNALHVVLAQNPSDSGCIIVTAYVPSLDTWKSDFKTKNKN